MQRISNQNCSKCGTSNDDQLRRLDEHTDVAMLHEVTANDRANYDHDSNNYEHVRFSSRRAWLVPGRPGCLVAMLSKRLLSSFHQRFQGIIFLNRCHSE